jgi:putative tryptophan/tyrosine transport system substrate-binding protein
MTSVTRRAFVFELTLGALVPALAAHAQTTGKVYRIGYLAADSGALGFVDAFREGLRELGWIEGKNIVIEYRFAEGQYDRLPALAAELVRLRVDLIAAGPTPPAVAAKNATRTIPIVMLGAAEPVELGLIESLAWPGGNVTGLSWSVDLEIIAKGLELLKETVPTVHLVGVLWNPANPAHAIAMRNVKATAGSLKVPLLLLEAREPNQFDGVFATMVKSRVDALLVVADGTFARHRARLAELAAKNRLPSLHGLREHVDAGDLMSYGPDLIATRRRAASFVDRILKGAKPADLPVEQPTKFELVINLKTAKALGMTIPPSVLARADQVIE